MWFNRGNLFLFFNLCFATDLRCPARWSSLLCCRLCWAQEQQDQRMDKSKSPAKLGKQSQPRGAKPLSKEKTNKDGHTHMEETVTTTRRQGTLNAVKEEHNPGSSGPGKMRGRSSRLTRLSGRTNFGESGKGKAANSHQQQVTEAPDSPGSYSTDSSPSTYRETGSPVVSGMTEKDLRERAGGGC